jgi:hypothetical protein
LRASPRHAPKTLKHQLELTKIPLFIFLLFFMIGYSGSGLAPLLFFELGRPIGSEAEDDRL